jgi:outer membrane protein assembly factor BamB
MRRWRLTAAGITAAATLAGILSGTTASGTTHANWPQYLYSARHSSFNSAATAITTSTARDLKQVWQFQPPPAPVEGLSGFYSSPTVYNGVIYIGARNGYFYAISESTGQVIWQRFIGYLPEKTCAAEGFTSTATVTINPATKAPTVYVYGATGYLYALETTTGLNVWPPARVAVPSATQSDYYAWASPLVVDGNIYVGISSECDRPLVRAGLAEFNEASGAYENTFWTTAPGTVGASIWSTPVFYGKSIYATTGNGVTGSDGYSLFKLTESMTQQGIWTVPPAARVTDSDFGGSPGLWTATIAGKPALMVGACNKNGLFYAFRADDISAGPVWSQQIANPSSTGPGECDAAPIWDGTHLYLATNGTVINGTSYNGSVLQVNPATGATIWQTGVTGAVIGTPSLDGGHVIAAASYISTTDQNGVWLINDANGKILNSISYSTSETFAQPVFADNYLLVASGTLGLIAYAPS